MNKRRVTKLVISILTLVILSALGAGARQDGNLALMPHPAAPPGFYPVTQVDDGDTIRVKIAGKDETVRFIGIDTPEVKDPRKPVQCFGKAASEQTHKLLDGKNVRLENDPQSSDRDKYHRLLRYVYAEDGTLVNRNLIENGYAFTYIVFPFTKMDEFRAAEASARTQNKGLWAGCQIHKDGQIEQTNA